MKKHFFTVTVASLLVLGLAGCTNTPAPAETSSPSGSSSSTPSPTSDTAEEPLAGPEEPMSQEDLDSLTEAEEAERAFPNVTYEGDEAMIPEIRLALYSASRYVNDIYNSGYLANGEWAKTGYDFATLYDTYNRYWTDEYAGTINGLINTHNEGVDDEAARQLLKHFFYYDPTDSTLTLPETCQGTDFSANSCLKDGKLDHGTDNWSFLVTKDGKIFVTMKFTANVLFVKDGVQGVSPVNYNIELEMVKNPDADEENGQPSYIVNSVGGTWNIDSWEPQEG